MAGIGKARQAGQGRDRQGTARQGRHGAAGLGKAGTGKAGKAAQGGAWQGMAQQGSAGKAQTNKPTWRQHMKITGYDKHGRLTERHATGKLIDIREKLTRHDAKAPQGTPVVKGDSDGAAVVLICIIGALLLAMLAAGGLI